MQETERGSTWKKAIGVLLIPRITLYREIARKKRRISDLCLILMETKRELDRMEREFNFLSGRMHDGITAPSKRIKSLEEKLEADRQRNP